MSEQPYTWTRNDREDHDAGHPSGFDCDGYAMADSEACGNRFAPASPASPGVMSRANTEVWRGVVGHEDGYEVSSMGRVRSLISGGKILKSTVDHKGYLTVTLRGKNRKVHQLVALAFVDGSGELVRHRNDIKDDNRAENLAWGSYSDNAQDAVANGHHWHHGKTHCDNGHEFTPGNTYIRPSRPNDRFCRACIRAQSKRYRDRKRAA